MLANLSKSQFRWVWVWVSLSGAWLILNGVAGFAPVQAQLHQVQTSDLPQADQRFLIGSFGALHVLSAWAIVAGLGVLIRQEFGRILGIGYCVAQLGLMGWRVLNQVVHRVRFGHLIQVDPQHDIPYRLLGSIMATIYVVAILIFLTRPKTVNFFKGGMSDAV